MSTANHDQVVACRAMEARGYEFHSPQGVAYREGWHDKDLDAQKYGAVFAGIKEKEISDLQKKIAQTKNDALEEVAASFVNSFSPDDRLDPAYIAACVLTHKDDSVYPVKPASAVRSDAIEAYDPNFQWGKQRVRIRLIQWGYKATIETVVGGNCQGFDIFDTAISNAYLDLCPDNEKEPASVVLTADDGETLLCEDDEENGEDWLAKMIVSVEIVSQEPGAIETRREGGKNE